MKFLVFDIGGTALKAGVYKDGEICNYRTFASDAKKGVDHILGLLYEKINEMLENEGKDTVDAIGISTAGQVDVKEGYIVYANDNIPGYTGCRLKDLIEEKYKIRTVVENDVNAAAIGEAFKGAAKDGKNFVVLTYGTGVGGSIFIDGNIYRGADSIAGEFGCIRLKEKEDNNDFYNGCYERLGSTTALVNSCKSIDPNITDGLKVFENEDKASIKQEIDIWTDNVATGLAQIVHILNPELIVAGGGVMERKELIPLIQKKMEEKLLPSFRKCKIKQAELGNKAGLYGMAKMCIG